MKKPSQRIKDNSTAPTAAHYQGVENVYGFSAEKAIREISLILDEMQDKIDTLQTL